VTTRLPDPASTGPRSLAALREIARALSSAWDLDTTLDLIARKTTEIMGVDSCAIYLLDADETTLRLRASTGLARRALGLATLQVGEGMTGYAVVQNRPVYAADAQHDPHFKWLDDTEERRFRSLLAVPLVLNDRPIGALNVQTAAPRDYSTEEIDRSRPASTTGSAANWTSYAPWPRSARPSPRRNTWIKFWKSSPNWRRERWGRQAAPSICWNSRTRTVTRPPCPSSPTRPARPCPTPTR